MEIDEEGRIDDELGFVRQLEEVIREEENGRSDVVRLSGAIMEVDNDENNEEEEDEEDEIGDDDDVEEDEEEEIDDEDEEIVNERVSNHGYGVSNRSNNNEENDLLSYDSDSYNYTNEMDIENENEEENLPRDEEGY